MTKTALFPARDAVAGIRLLDDLSRRVGTVRVKVRQGSDQPLIRLRHNCPIGSVLE